MATGWRAAELEAQIERLAAVDAGRTRAVWRAWIRAARTSSWPGPTSYTASRGVWVQASLLVNDRGIRWGLLYQQLASALAPPAQPG